ncbi:12799_t:CDS:2 [Entrophospora sp. SA101]|nr:12799_t:CDS:2 [Entrophospora sp. SA101]
MAPLKHFDMLKVFKSVYDELLNDVEDNNNHKIPITITSNSPTTPTTLISTDTPSTPTATSATPIATHTTSTAIPNTLISTNTPVIPNTLISTNTPVIPTTLISTATPTMLISTTTPATPLEDEDERYSVLLDDDLVIVEELQGPWASREYTVLLDFMFRKNLNCRYLRRTKKLHRSHENIASTWREMKREIKIYYGAQF